MLLYTMLYIVLAYLMLFAALTNSVCLNNASFFFLFKYFICQGYELSGEIALKNNHYYYYYYHDCYYCYCKYYDCFSMCCLVDITLELIKRYVNTNSTLSSFYLPFHWLLQKTNLQLYIRLNNSMRNSLNV